MRSYVYHANRIISEQLSSWGASEQITQTQVSIEDPLSVLAESFPHTEFNEVLMGYSFYRVQYTLNNILLRGRHHDVTNTPITYLPLPTLHSITSLEDCNQTPCAALPEANTRSAPAPAQPAMPLLSQRCETLPHNLRQQSVSNSTTSK